MRIAICLVGIVGTKDKKYGKGSKVVDYRIGHYFHNKNIIEPNKKENHQVDIFIHSWSTEFKNELVDIYQPKKYIIENQIDFKMPTIRENSIKSRWYSTKKSVELKKQYEIENNFTYDFVMIYRFDHILMKELLFSQYNFEKFYCSHRDDCVKSCVCFQTNTFYDAWFFSNSKNIDMFSTLYDTLEKNSLESPHSQCVKHLYEIGFKEKLSHTMFFRRDHNTIREIFSNCEYHKGSEFDVNKLIKI